MAALKESYAHWGALIILLKGLTPIPYKLVTIVSGLLGYNFAIFVAALVGDARRAVFYSRRRAQLVRRSPATGAWSVISPYFSG